MTGSITTKAAAEAVRTVTQMSLQEKEELIDRIHEVQPHILLSVLALSQDGVPPEMLEHALHLLMVVHVCVTTQHPGPLPQASRDHVVRAANRHMAMLSYLEKEPDPKMRRLTCTSYPEPAPLAYVVNYLLEHGLCGETDAQHLVSSMSKVALDLYVDAHLGRLDRTAEQGKR